MKTKELIERLKDFENNYTSISSDDYIDDELINEVVKRLEELERLKGACKKLSKI
ncbi:hypothetical protein LCGC14_1757550 [marine sediment metagenome]|uniref:Uncharacterized protein n=1 Tax=marine sediment metagenome TaxID=412755 RepID=A0A0F9HPB9_9ZZZZ